ncbi:conserved hypothetical protein [Rhodospirillaceae bacterium LM-1]|nr:conserved hypothetical protein [Rhodospirillaceae bacterium LM-1]
MKIKSSIDKALADAQKLHAKGKLREAEAIFAALIKAYGRDAPILTELAKAAAMMGEREVAISLFRRAVAAAPLAAAAHYNLGKALKSDGSIADAIHAYKTAIQLDPLMAEAHYNLGNALCDQGQTQDGVAAFLRATAVEPENDMYWSNYLLALNYLDSCSPQECFSRHRQWGELRESGIADGRPAFSNKKDPERRLVLGYVSADFRTHSVSYFFEPLAATHTRSHYKVVLYDNQPTDDDVAKRLKSAADLWRPIRRLADQDVERIIRSDKVDILVDLSGHSSNNRLGLFARRPAPVQLTWIGYPNTTGLKSIDWRFTDDIADPPGATDDLHTERLFRLPHGFLCFRPPEAAPEIVARTACPQDRVVFGCLNNFSKISNSVLALWVAILKELPQAALLLKNQAFVMEASRNLFMERLTALGGDGARVELLPPVGDKTGHLETYNRIDVALDTFPYAGTATTCESLWMGTPVITLTGESHASRVGASLLERLGLHEHIAATPDQYVAKAVALAKDSERRHFLKQNLRNMMRNSNLMNAPLFTHSVEGAYRQFWREWCERN